MAGIALILRYQWRAFWRRFIRTRQRAHFYFTALAVLLWAFFAILPAALTRAATELAAGQTTSMDAVLWSFCALWLVVLVEDASVSLTSRHLRAFPLEVGQLLAVRMLSVFCSPVAMMVALGSLISLWPFFLARHTVLGIMAALLLFATALAFALSVSQLLAVEEWIRTLVAIVAVVGLVLGAPFIGPGFQDIERLWTVMAVTPPHLVSSVSVAATPSAIIAPLMTLLAMSAVISALLFWSFRRSVFRESPTRARGRTVESVLWFPGRFGGLVRKEQQDLRKLLDIWPGVLLVAAVSVASLFFPVRPIVRQSIIVIVFVFNTNAIMNCFGLNTSAELNRYAILPLRGQDVLLVKNLGLMMIVAGQLAVLILTAAWQSGLSEAGADILVAGVLLLSHLAWGNPVSVAAPFKVQPYHFASSGSPVTALIGSAIGSTPGVGVLILLHSKSPWAVAGIVGLLLLSVVLYRVSLRYSGRSFEHERHIIGEQLS